MYSVLSTNDVHYIEKEDAEMQNVLMCIQIKKTIYEPNSLKFPTEEFYLKSGQEMSELFRNFPEAIVNTSIIADKCNVEFEFGVIKLPKFHIDGEDDNIAFFRKLCYDGLKKRYGENFSENIKKRMDYELDIIIGMGYVDYYLIVWDFVKYSKDNNIPVGPGRGSGAGSICAYCIEITDIDPIKYNLLFERFLNPERVSMPDFDIDFCIEGRQKVIDYVVEKYGSDRVSQIIAFDTLKARAAIKDTGRTMGLSVKFRNDVSSLVPRDLNITIAQALEKSKELKELYDSNYSAHKLIDMSMKIEGMPRNDSIHAAGVVISGVPVTDLVPVKKSGDAVVTQYTMTALESLGLLKMDFLGLRNLTVIKHCVEEIRKKVKHVLDMVDLEGFEDRKISTLSGGQQQRIAIARALVNEPEILMLDEPLGALDLKMRKEMQIELKNMHDQLGITFIYVTHDQEEALTMSDKIVVLSEGKIQQIGTPEDIYNEPKNAFVADFIGESNIFKGIMTGHMKVRFCGGEFVGMDDVPEGTLVDVVIRPEDVIITKPEDGTVVGEVTSVIFKGMHYEVAVESGKYEMIIRTTRCYHVGDTVGMQLEPDGIHVMIAEDHTTSFVTTINGDYTLDFNGKIISCDLTQVIPKTKMSDGVLVDENGENVDVSKFRVVVSIQPDDIEMSDDVTAGLVSGKIINLIYKGDHYSYVIRTEYGHDLIVDDEYLWNMDDHVGLIMPEEKMKFQLKK